MDYQWYLFVSSRVLVYLEGLLTQLVFEHSSRIRLKAEASNENVEEGNLTVIGTQDSALVAEVTTVDSNLGETWRASQTSQVSTPISRDSSSESQSTSNGPVKRKNKDSSTLKSDNKSATKDKKELQNLIGKINNLVTVPVVLSCICLFLQIIHILLHWINAFRKHGSVIESEST